MKYLCLATLLFGTLLGNAQKFDVGLNIGVPINKLSSWESPNYEIDSWIGKRIKKNALVGMGSSYSVVDLLASNTFLTFDRNVLTFYGFYMYKTKLSKRVKFLPQLRLGYSLINSKLNEFPAERQKTNGLYTSGNLFFGFSLHKNLDLVSGVGFNMLFAKLETYPDSIIPANYFYNHTSTINQLRLKLGGIYYF